VEDPDEDSFDQAPITYGDEGRNSQLAHQWTPNDATNDDDDDEHQGNPMPSLKRPLQQHQSQQRMPKVPKKTHVQSAGSISQSATVDRYTWSHANIQYLLLLLKEPKYRSLLVIGGLKGEADSKKKQSLNYGYIGVDMNKRFSTDVFSVPNRIKSKIHALKGKLQVFII